MPRMTNAALDLMKIQPENLGFHYEIISSTLHEVGQHFVHFEWKLAAI